MDEKKFKKLQLIIIQPSHISLMLAAILICTVHKCNVTNSGLTLWKEPEDCWR